jgi:PAS domain S-box-containing protein
MSYKDKNITPDFLTIEGKLGEMIRHFDWASTPLGQISDWPQSLKTTINLMLNSKNPVWIAWGSENIFLYNDACIDILGKDKHAWALGEPASIVWKEIWDIYEPLINTVHNKGISTAVNDHRLYINRNGTTENTIISVAASPVFGESGTIAGIFCQQDKASKQDTKTDSTFYKKLEESEAKFRTLIHQAPSGIVILKGRDLVLDVINEVYLSVYNKKREDVTGRKLTEVLPDMKGSATEANLLKVYDTGKSITVANRPIESKSNGKKTTRYFNTVFQPLIENNKVTGVICIVNEVTEQYLSHKIREQNEKDLMQILGTIPHIAYRTKPDGMVTYYNDRYFNYTGLTPEQALNDGWKPAIHPDMLEEVTNGWMESINTGKDFDAVFLIKRASDGAYRWHMARGVALHNEKNEITEWVGTLTDIHEQKIFEEELEAKVNDRTLKLNTSNKLLAQKNIELEKSNKELESFNYVASHDLQEPLRKIQTFISMIKEWKMEGETADIYINKIYASAERMSQLIQDVLIYSRISTEEQFTETDLNCILSHVITDYELFVADKNATIETSPLPVIKAIPRQMHQLFSNLLSNSLKYSSESPRITVSGKIIQAENTEEYMTDYAEIVFSDNGIGFDPQYSEQIFRLFQRLHSKTEYCGTGVGLSICKKIADQHKGMIIAESTPGYGATFTIRLPV